MPCLAAYAGMKAAAFVQHAGGGLILAARDVAELVAVVVDADGVGVEWVGWFADELDTVADGQQVPECFAFVVLESGHGALLDEPKFCLAALAGTGEAGQGGQAEQAG